MNTRSLSQSAQKIHRKEAPYFHVESEATPKKQASLIKLQQPDIPSTLQKETIFESEVKLETIRKDKKKPKRPWTPQQDKLLRELVLTKGAKQWAFISSFFFDRCGKQCRERWHNHLRNGIKKGDWSYDEEWLLYLGVQAYGKRWSLISKMLEGRTQNTLKNHWNCKLKPKKDSFFKKLALLLKNCSNSSRLLTKCELQLIKMIKAKPYTDGQVDLTGETNEDKLRINFFQKALKNFYEVKREIYKAFEAETLNEEVKIAKQTPMEWNMVDSFGKNKYHLENEKSTDDNQKKSDLAEDIINSHQSYEMCEEIEFESDSFNMKIAGLMKAASSMEEEIFDENEDCHYEEFECNHAEQREKSFAECKSFSEDFYSPFKRNIFEGIDLGESNIKEKLFE